MALRLSVMVPTYNCAGLLEQTLRSVLGEGLPGDEAEVVVVDDASTADDPERVVRDVGRGRVGFVRQARNVGAIRNFNTCVGLARGEWVHILHGDDFVLPGFYKAVLDSAARFPDVGLVCTRSFIVDEGGEIDGLSPRLRHLEAPSREVRPLIYGGNLMHTPSVVVRKAVYARCGGFEESLVHVADWEMWVRAVGSSGGVCVNRPLAAYRVFAAQDTARLRLTGENLRDHLRLCDRWVAGLPGFDEVAFLRMLDGIASRQVANLTAKGLSDAVAANARVRDEIRARLSQPSEAASA
jgi:glycosyltransferase involved in cell wall biosynthesis